MLKKYIKYYLAVLPSLIISISPSFADIIEVNIAYVGTTDHNNYLGARQGLSEANLQGQFLNQKYTLDVISLDNTQQVNFANYIAIIAAIDKKSFQQLINSNPNTPIFNINLSDDEVRTDCFTNALHVIPSDRMKADAINQWLQKNPESGTTAQAWHPDFVKFAARDLNKRFLKTQKTKMDDFAWAGWAAVKMTADTVARKNITEPEKLLDYLKTELSFDGQKGINMNFRETGQLRQPILLIEDDKIVAEAPVRGVAKPPSVESLGFLNCPK
jgi:hypothetical protein